MPYWDPKAFITAPVIGGSTAAAALGFIDPTLAPYNAIVDGIQRFTGQISPGGNVLTDAAGFTAADVGKTIVIKNAGNVQQYATGAITSGQTTLTIDVAASITLSGFHMGQEGWLVEIAGAGPAGGVLRTTFATITNSGTATLSAAASTTVTGATVTFAAALQTTITAQTATTATLAASCGSGWSAALTGQQYDYGTDNTTALNNALAAGPVWLRPGRWCHTDVLNVTSTTMVGADRGSTRIVGLVSDASGNNAVKLEGTNAHIRDFGLENQYFQARNTGFGRCGIWLNGCSQYSVQHIDIDGAAGQGIKGVATATNPVQRGLIFDVDVANTLADGIAFAGSANGLDIAYNQVIDCRARNVGDDGFAISQQLGMAGEAHHNLFLGCVNDTQRLSAPGDGFSLAGGYSNTIADCFSMNATLAGVRVTNLIPSGRSFTGSITSGTTALSTSAPFVTTTTADGTITNGQTTITSATGKFNSLAVGALVTVAGGTLPAGTTILSVQNAYNATLSAAATGSSTNGDLTIVSLVGSDVRPADPSMVQVFGAGVGGAPLTATVTHVTDSTHFTLDIAASTTVGPSAYIQSGSTSSVARFGNATNRDITISNVTAVNSFTNVGTTTTVTGDFVVHGLNSQQTAENITITGCKSINPKGYFLRTNVIVVGDVTADQVITGLYVTDFTGRTNQTNSTLGITPEGIRLGAGRNIHISGRLKDTAAGGVVVDTNTISGVVDLRLDLVDINRGGASGSTVGAIKVNAQSAGVTPRITGTTHSNPSGTSGGTKYVCGYVIDAQIAGAQFRDNTSSVAGQTIYNATSSTLGRWLSPIGVLGTLTPVLNKLYAVPIDLTDPELFTAIALEITTAATGGTTPKVRLGVYANSLLNSYYGIPGALILDAGVIDATILYATTPGKITGLSLQRPPEKLWLVMAFQESTSGTPSGLIVRSITSGTPGVPNVTTVSAPPGNNTSCGWVESGVATTGAFPGTFPAGVPGLVPRVVIG